MKMLKNWKIKENIIKVLKTYPFVLCAIFAIGALGIYLIHSETNEDFILKVNFSIAVFAGIALNLRALNLSYESFTNKKHLILLAVGAMLCFGYYFTLDVDVEWTITRTVIIIFIEGLLFISLPFIKNDEKTEHFTNLAAGRLIISGVFFGIAYGGVAGVLFALEELFGIDISYKVYSDAGVILATTFLPMLWLFGLDYKVNPSTSKLYKVLLCFVCIPLLFVYTAVVYGFILKIIFDGFVMPSSIIGHLVLWYSFVSIIVFYLARPYKDNSLTKFFYKWYPLMSVLPLTIMFIAIFMRINQYAVTVNRYYLLLGGIFLAIMFGYLIYVRFAKKKPLNIVTTLMLALFALISIVEPISADNVAEHSQLNRLEGIVSPYIENGALDVSKMDDAEILQAQDILRYLDWNHDYHDYLYANDEVSDHQIDFMTREDVDAIFAIDVNRYEYIKEEHRYYYADNRWDDHGVHIPKNVEGYKYLLDIHGYDFNNGDEYYLNEYQIQIDDIENDDDRRIDSIIYIHKNNVLIAELSMVECYGDILDAKREAFGDADQDFVYETADKSVRIVLYEIEFWIDDKVYVSQFEAYLLIK